MDKYIKELTYVISNGSMENTYKMGWVRSLVDFSIFKNMDTYKRRSIKRIDRCISKVLKRTNTDYRFIGRIVTDFLVTNRFQVGDVIGGRSFYNLFIVIRTTPRMIVYNHLLTSERMKSRVIDDHVMFDRVLLLKKWNIALIKN